MRDYGIVSPMFWVGATGRSLRKNPNAQRVAIYFMTSPMSEMTGVYYCPLASILNDVGTLEAPSKPLASPLEGGIDRGESPFEGVKQAILTLMELNFCFYDFESEFVFVNEMARWQIGESLKEKDNRVAGLRKSVRSMPKSIAARFVERYNEDFCLGFDLETFGENLKGKPSPSEAPSKPLTRDSMKPLRSQEQEQEQYISTDVDIKEKIEKEKPKSKRTKLAEQPPTVTDQTWNDFQAVRKAKHAPLTVTALNGIVKQADEAGITIEEALKVCCERGWQSFKAEWYFNIRQSNNRPMPRSKSSELFEEEWNQPDYYGDGGKIL